MTSRPTRSSGKARRVLMTLDSVGGVWRYAMDLAASLKQFDTQVVFVGLGPTPSAEQQREAEGRGKLVWLDASLDWMVEDEGALTHVPDLLGDLADHEQVDLLHLNLPSQAAGLRCAEPVLVVSHSCVVSWFDVVRGQDVPPEWRWQKRLNRQGLRRADVVVAPSRSHADLLNSVYRGIKPVDVVHNGSGAPADASNKEDFVIAAGRWWDDGKNGAVLDAAAAMTDWPVVMAGATEGPNGQHLDLKHGIGRGALSHEATMRLMQRAAIAVSPSLYEPFGLVPLEAAHQGAALVLADIPTYRELWDGAALFADPRDPAALSAQINLLARHPEERRDYAQRALLRSRLFTLSAQAKAMNDKYDGLLGRSRSLSAA